MIMKMIMKIIRGMITEKNSTEGMINTEDIMDMMILQ